MMDSDWMLVIVLWAGIIVFLITFGISELKKTPEQKKAEAEMARERGRKRREEEKRKRQEAQANAPTMGCLESTVRFGCLCTILMVVIIVCIMMLIASGE